MYTVIDGKTQIFGLLGENISYTLSPLIWNVAFKHLRLNAIYIPINIKCLDFQKVLSSLFLINNIRGFNVTVPYKEKAIKFCTDLSFPADVIKAINTVYIKGAKIIGYNTDALALLEILRKIRKTSVLVIGAGGAAKAVLWALSNFSCKKIVWTNRSFVKIQQGLNFEIRGLQPVEWGSKDLINLAKDLDLVINATSLGWKPEDRIEWLNDIFENNSQSIFFDLNYNYNSPLQILAKNAKISIINGLDMLIKQAAIAFKIFTNQDFPTKVVKYHLKKCLNILKY